MPFLDVLMEYVCISNTDDMEKMSDSLRANAWFCFVIGLDWLTQKSTNKKHGFDSSNFNWLT